MKIQVTKQAEKKMLKGYPLIQEEDLRYPLEKFPQEWITFTDSADQFIAYGYLADQNKGIGWLLSWNEQLTSSFFDKLFLKAKEARSFYFHDETTSAYRLFNGEGDGIGGMTIDCYNDFAVFSWYNETIYANRKAIIESFQRVFKDIAGAYEKIRFTSEQLPESKKIFGKDAPEPLIIVENGVSYATYLNEGLMTGIFLDQKEVRGELVNGYAAGQRVLNMFSYTGAFSVAAAMGGAAETTSVDLAKRSSAKTAEQFTVNQFPLEHHRIVVMDVFEYFNYAKRKELTFDCIILDPPSFARNKKKVFTVVKNYGDLVKQSVEILEDKGTIIASTNAANVTLKRFRKMVEEALVSKNVTYTIEEMYQLPADFKVNPDFPEGNYLKVLFLKIVK